MRGAKAAPKSGAEQDFESNVREAWKVLKPRVATGGASNWVGKGRGNWRAACVVAVRENGTLCDIPKGESRRVSAKQCSHNVYFLAAHWGAGGMTVQGGKGKGLSCERCG